MDFISIRLFFFFYFQKTETLILSLKGEDVLFFCIALPKKKGLTGHEMQCLVNYTGALPRQDGSARSAGNVDAIDLRSRG